MTRSHPAMMAALLAALAAAPPGHAAESGRPVVQSRDGTGALTVTLHAADRALAAGRPAEALRLYDQALAQDPRAVPVRYGRAMALHRLGRAAEAIVAYREVVRMEPDHAQALANLASLVAATKPAEALVELRRLQALQPGNPWVAAQIGLLLAETGAWQEGLAQLAFAAEAAPDDTVIQYDLAIALDRMGRVGEAIQHYERVLALPPDAAVQNGAVRDRLVALRGRRNSR